MACKAGMVAPRAYLHSDRQELINRAQITNFLKYMAKNIKLESIGLATNGHHLDAPKAKTRFYPVRRKLDILNA
jgi:hypothetical protein